MHSLKLFFLKLLFFLLVSCSFHKVDDAHGVNNLLEKSKLITINKSNKNDVIRLLGPSLITSNNEMKFSYFEVRKTKNKLGSNVIYTNNYIEITFDKYGIVEKINIYNTDDNKNLNFAKETTVTRGVKDTFFSNLLSSTRKRMEKAREKYKKN